MLQKFKKLEEQIYNSDVDSKAEMTFCNPSEIEKESEKCEVVTINESDSEMHKEKDHLETNGKEVPSENESKEEDQIKTSAIVYKCDMCEFKTIHHPG